MCRVPADVSVRHEIFNGSACRGGQRGVAVLGPYCCGNDMDRRLFGRLYPVAADVDVRLVLFAAVGLIAGQWAGGQGGRPDGS